MSEQAKEFYTQYKKDTGKLSQAIPDTYKGFKGMFDSIMKDGALLLKTKELMAVSISVALRCEPCILLHVKKCLDIGATKEEILEAASVAVIMQGGPALTYLQKVQHALEANGQ